MRDIGRLLGAQFQFQPYEANKEDKEAEAPHLIVSLDRTTLEAMKVNLESWCRSTNLHRTLAFIQQIDLGLAPAAALQTDAPSLSPAHVAGSRNSAFHPLWVWFNVAKYILGISIAWERGPAQIALLIYTGLPYLILLLMMIWRKVRISSGMAPILTHESSYASSHRFPGFMHFASRWLFDDNLGLLLHVQRLINVFLILAGILSPAQGTPFDPLSKNAKNFWSFSALMRVSNMTMEVGDQ